MELKDTELLCSACKGKIIERFKNQAIFKGRRGIIGPGGRQFSHYGKPKSVGFHCKKCGIEYNFEFIRNLLEAKLKGSGGDNERKT